MLSCGICLTMHGDRMRGEVGKSNSTSCQCAAAGMNKDGLLVVGFITIIEEYDSGNRLGYRGTSLGWIILSA
jgi:hypothetical protein